eukprot:12884830-Prorocentrum_lima.AAC.1
MGGRFGKGGILIPPALAYGAFPDLVTRSLVLNSLPMSLMPFLQQELNTVDVILDLLLPL